VFWRKRHEVTQDDLSAYVDGELPPARLAAVERHLAGCEACRTAVEELNAVRTMLAAMPAITPARSFTLSAAQAEKPVAARPASRGRSPFAFAPAIAAVLFVAIVGADLASNASVSDDDAGGAPTLAMESARQADSPAAGAPAPSGGAGGAANGATPELPYDSGASAPDAGAEDGDEGEDGDTSSLAPVPPPGEEPATATGATSGVEAEDGDDGPNAWRIAEALALVALAGSLFLAWRARTAD
jgi:anti-sigma factor RsiW